MTEPLRFTVIYRTGTESDFQWHRAEWTNSLPYAETQAHTINELGKLSGTTIEAHAVNWLSPLPDTFSYVPR
jgi:hypothetical protein